MRQAALKHGVDDSQLGVYIKTGTTHKGSFNFSISSLFTPEEEAELRERIRGLSNDEESVSPRKQDKSALYNLAIEEVKRFCSNKLGSLVTVFFQR